MRIPILLLLTLVIGSSVCRAESNFPDEAYRRDFAQWKSDLESDLRKNWLTLVGLFWLKDGANRVGGDVRDEIPLPADKVPRQVGVIEFDRNKAEFHSNPAAKVTSAGKPVDRIELKSDDAGNPTVLDIGDLHFYLIQRGQKFGVRVKDSRSRFLAEFKGTVFYPADQHYIVTGTFIPYGKPQKVKVPTEIGQPAQIDRLGEIEFPLNGRKLRLKVFSEKPSELFIIFKDQTSGKTTYPPGRFLRAAAPRQGKVVLDFNRAYSPPCAWTPFATCPLAPQENYLGVAIEAGEKFASRR